MVSSLIIVLTMILFSILCVDLLLVLVLLLLLIVMLTLMSIVAYVIIWLLGLQCELRCLLRILREERVHVVWHVIPRRRSDPFKVLHYSLLEVIVTFGVADTTDKGYSKSHIECLHLFILLLII